MTQDSLRPDPRFALAHATGFCAAVWDPFVGAIGNERVRRWSFAGHGASLPPPPPLTWWRFGSQALAETKPGMVGVGHSMGGAALVMAELMEPGHFESLVLIEPVIFPSFDPGIAEGMADHAARRRAFFADRAEARKLFERKDVFARWHPEAMEGYIREGLVASDFGVQLACAPAFEADVYRSCFEPTLWGRLAEIRCPVLVICGSDSDTYDTGQVERIGAEFPRAETKVITNAGHFLPMEVPFELARLVEGFSN